MKVSPEQREKVLAYLADELEVQMLDEEELAGPRARIPFWSPMLTWATTGGVKLGQTCRWFGPEGSGKSLTNLGLIWAAQRFPELLEQDFERKIKFLESRRGKKLARVKANADMRKLLKRHQDPLSTFIIDAEGRFEPDFARQLGIEVSKEKCWPVFENIIENVIEAAMAAVEAYDIIVLDSAAACESIETATKDVGEYERGADPRAWRRLKRLTRSMKKKNPDSTFIIVDQVRTQLGNLGARGQAMVQPPNVRIIKHQASLAIEFAEGKKLYLDKEANLTDDYEKASNAFPHLGTNGKEPHGLEMRAKVIKNSTGKPFRNARSRMKFNAVDRHGEVVQEPGFDVPFELFETALEFGMIEKSGSHYHRLDNEGNRYPKKDKKRSKSMHGEAQGRVAIDNDPEWAEEIRQKLVAMT